MLLLENIKKYSVTVIKSNILRDLCQQIYKMICFYNLKLEDLWIALKIFLIFSKFASFQFQK